MACAQFCSDMIPYNGATLKPIFHLIYDGKSVHEMGSCLTYDVITMNSCYTRPVC